MCVGVCVAVGVGGTADALAMAVVQPTSRNALDLITAVIKRQVQKLRMCTSPSETALTKSLPLLIIRGYEGMILINQDRHSPIMSDF